MSDYLLVGIRSIVAAGFCDAVGFGEGVVAVASCVEGAACTESRCPRCRDFVVAEPGVEAGGCEAQGAAVEGVDGGAFVASSLDRYVCAVVVGCSCRQATEGGAEGFGNTTAYAACQGC